MRSTVLLSNVVEHAVDEFVDLGLGGIAEGLQLPGLASYFLLGGCLRGLQ
jgi:hypothetical protein